MVVGPLIVLGCAGVLLVMVMALDVAVAGDAQAALLVITHVITLPSAIELLEYVAPVPTFVVPFFH